MARNSSNQKVANSLVAMSSAVVLAVYSAGYVRTRPAADRLAQQALQRTIARQAPPSEAAPDGPVATAGHSGERGTTMAAETSPAASTHSDPKATTAAAPRVTASAAPANATTQVPSAGAAPSPAETTAAVAIPVSAPVTSVAPVAEQTANVPAAAPAAPSPNVWKDGKYVAWGGSRHGDIQATVVIEGGHIVSAEISECQTRYSCDVIEKLPPQVIKRQSPNVDRVSGATESADAFYSAVYFALGQAH